MSAMLSEGDERVPIAGAEVETPRPPSGTSWTRLWGVGAVLALTMVACVVAGGLWSGRLPAHRALGLGPGAAFVQQKSEDEAPLVLVYNALLFEPVLKALLCRVPEVQPVLFPDFERRIVRDEDYPGLLDVGYPGGPLRALVLLDLSPSEVKILDLFQENFFKKGGFVKKEVDAWELQDVDDPITDTWSWAQREPHSKKADRYWLEDVSGNEPLHCVTYVADDGMALGSSGWAPDRFDERAFANKCEEFVRDKVPAELKQTCEGK